MSNTNSGPLTHVQRTEKALLVGCPSCGAQAGQRCTTSGGHAARPHVRRYQIGTGTEGPHQQRRRRQGRGPDHQSDGPGTYRGQQAWFAEQLQAAQQFSPGSRLIDDERWVPILNRWLDDEVTAADRSFVAEWLSFTPGGEPV